MFQITLDIQNSLEQLTGGNPFKIETIADFVSGLVGISITFALLAMMIMLVFGGFQWLTSGGDAKAVEAARNRITQALIGLTIVASVWALMKIVEIFFGVQILEPSTGRGPTPTPILICPRPPCPR